MRRRSRRLWPHAATAAVALALAACSSAPPAPERAPGPETTAKPGAPSKPPSAILKRGGGFYKDDGPLEIPIDLAALPDATPKWEPLHKPAMKPYVVLGQSYVPNKTVVAYKARGIASWYGRKFHGQKTSIGEPYDMFAMSAAHTTLALPSYVRVTNPANGVSVVVRVIDRGPFHPDRIIDLSYAAAWKLGIVASGSGLVDVEAIIPGDPTNTSYPQVASFVRGETAPIADADELGDLIVRLDKPDAPPAAPAGKATWLQLGAFGNRENADSLRAHLGRALDWLTDSIQIYSANGIQRVQVGPYRSRAEAEKVAERINSEFGTRPTIVVR